MNYLMLFVGLSFFIYKIILVMRFMEGGKLYFNYGNK